MADNRYGLDDQYFTKWLERVLAGGLQDWAPHELARELARMSKAADKKVMHEPEFQSEELAALRQQLEEAQTRADKAEQRLANAGDQEAVGYLVGGNLRRTKLRGYDCKPLYLHPAPPATDERVKKLEAVYAAARGICFGEDWNKGIMAKYYRQDLICAVNAIEPLSDGLAARKADGKEAQG